MTKIYGSHDQSVSSLNVALVAALLVTHFKMGDLNLGLTLFQRVQRIK